MSDPIRDWARDYTGELRELPKSHRPAAQRARLLFAHRRRSNSSLFSRHPLGAAGFALAGGALVLASTLLWRTVAPTKPTVPAPNTSNHSPYDSEELAVGRAIATFDEPKTLMLPNGSRAVWDRNSKGAVLQVSARTVELTLDEGSLAMDVERQEGRTWIVRSGAFRVYVVGTAFSVSRSSSSEEVKVTVKRGQVRVEGPDIQGGKVLLGEREEFAWRPQKELRSETKPIPAPETPSGLSPDETDHSTNQTRAKSHSDSEISQSWQALARSGKYERALEEVEESGVDRVLASSNADDRLLLGNAARYSGHIDLGSRAYLAARKSDGAAASLAAYYLAKIAIDTGDQSSAIRWLETYLREAPSGDLAASARARLMSLLQATGSIVKAQRMARQYMTLHPTGPNAEMARKLLERP